MSMTLDEYQSHVLRTSNPAVDDDPDRALTNWALGLTGEAGEFADMVKKAVFHEHGLDEEKAVKELGDILWYVAKAASTLGYPLSLVASVNVEKLRTRYPNGWTREDSLARVDTQTVAAPLGGAHQTGGWETFCAAHTFPCPEWCEADPRDLQECAS